MIKSKRVVALTPLRGQSKSVKDKNLKPVGGFPLLAWPLKVAKSSPSIDRVLVSTDSERLATEAKKYGAEIYMRPAQLATDTALVIDVVQHLYVQLRKEGEPADIMVLLEATSPLRSVNLVEQCLRRLVEEELDSIATFSSASINPHRSWKIEHGRAKPFIDGAIPWLPRQQLPEAYQLNGAVYAFYPDRIDKNSPSLLFGKSGAQVVHEPTIDIDTEEDFIHANALFESGTIPSLGGFTESKS